ncbi:MAG: ribose-phosphate diphosphokinase [Euryarchaeota archaeon]|nr:ribose-phosphate diphosphokinase [Euryarchaeota archaeon]
MSMIILGGSKSQGLASRLAAETGASLGELERRRFPDTEAYVRLKSDVAGERVVIVATTHPDQALVELLLLGDAVRRQRPESITTIVPYYAYGRQDRVFLAGETVSAEVVARLIQGFTDEFVTVDPHKEHILSFFKCKAGSVTAVPTIAEHVKAKHVDLVLAPDKGALERAQSCAAIMGVDADHLDKVRLDAHTVELRPKNLSVRDKNVLILDDIISTGGTVMKAAAELKKQGAQKVMAACTHGLFAAEALAHIRTVCDDVIATDTVESSVSVVSVAKSIAKAL